MEFVLYTDIFNSTTKVLFYVHDAQHFYRADGDWDGDDRRIYFTTTDRGNTNSDISFNLFTSDYPYGGGPSEFDRNLGNHDGFLLVGRYIFAQQTDSNGVVALYVSDRRQPFKKAMIPLPDDHERYNGVCSLGSHKMKASTLTTYTVPATALSILLTLAQYIPCTPGSCVN